MRSLQSDWLHKISSITRVAFGDVAKGWYDMTEKIYGIYDISKLERFNQAILHRMQVKLAPVRFGLVIKHQSKSTFLFNV